MYKGGEERELRMKKRNMKEKKERRRGGEGGGGKRRRKEIRVHRDKKDGSFAGSVGN